MFLPLILLGTGLAFLSLFTVRFLLAIAAIFVIALAIFALLFGGRRKS